MKKLLTVSALVASVALSAGVATTASAADDNVRIATNVPYKPMEYAKPDGTLTGFDIDLGNALCKQAGLDCSWVRQGWNGIIPGLMARRYDAIMSSMTINEQRKKHVLFSNPYIVVPSAFFVPSGSPIDHISDEVLKGKKIGVQRGTVQDNYVTDKYGDIADITRYQNADDVAVDMAAGRLDLAFFDQITGQSALIDAHPGKYHQVGPSMTQPKKYFGSGFGIAFRKNEQDLADKFNKALAALKDNGTYAKIYKKYFHKAPPAGNGS
ncbi:transporter substrate-binding domain-containing protein [Salinisphaera sp.]|uniref:transporter substrate-binding domain-containing protein n=1 Tax=Salinisphaera sp. TaxID=1914330 RepID=UPI002D79D0A6|nr:transporter substrate-binding domain-containing protein [Salinisphaera sp.]HET7315168.1 transporter substrate-binding domain-containing protein [Salinisphaera sp.]